MKNLKTILLFFVITLSAHQFANAQQAKLNNAATNLKVIGTSNLHDWDMTAENVSGEIAFEKENNALTAISKLTLEVKVEGLKSGRRGLDGNAYKALDSKKYPEVKYSITKVNSITSRGNNTFAVATTGQLTIMNTTKEVPIEVNVTLKGNQVEVAGKYTLNMTHFGVEPPTALLGTVRTAEEVTIEFQLLYN
ncbi:MAG TPA: YceI family protein [Flavobacteriaceae bacterium]|nr:YceI family protein [Flavobacteriaceae bacterium]